MMPELYILAAFSPVAIYAVAWVCSTAYFNAKFAYQRRFLNEIQTQQQPNQRGD